ncbi:MAG TPA: hypothetical protein VNM90_07830 [Haliangium sp.]|nr:hypothetical protein [Haliangium sp.]
MMHRSIFAILFACAAVLATACEKPKEEDCKRAVANIRNLFGTANFAQGMPPQAAVRSCRGSASTESVRCIIAATTLQELSTCTGGGEFLEVMKGAAQPAPAAPAQPQPATAPAQGQPAEPATAPAQGQPEQPATAPEQPAGAPADQQPSPGQGAK